jgi:phosphoglycolate phosphatase
VSAGQGKRSPADSQVVMLDHDGVIADSLSTFCSSVIEGLRQIGRPDLATCQQVVDFLNDNWFVALAREGVSDDDAMVIEDVFTSAMARDEDLRPFPGMREAIASLAKHHILVIITSSRSELVRGFLARHDITGVGHVIGADEETSKVRKIASVKARYGDGRGYWYVGDTTGDMREGKQAGATTVGVAWGWHGAEKLRAAGADYVVATPQELVAVIDG